MTGADKKPQPRLEAASPFELRVDLGAYVSDEDLRSAVTTGNVGFVHSFTTGSTLDGPGVRLVLWLSGCHFRCLYCHNPDTWEVRNGLPIPLERAIAELGKYRHRLMVMHGGLTISGGEPLMQHRFVNRLITAAKGMGIHTALDTNGYLGSRLSDENLKNIDLVLLDIKSWSRERHLRLTGFDNRPAFDFARRLAALRRPVWFRFVLVPGLTDDPREIREIASFAARLGNVLRVDVLPFHQRGEFKWRELGIKYELEGIEAPAPDAVENARGVFRAIGLKAY